MRYCRFLFEGHAHYGKVEERGNEPWIVDLASAPPEDLAYQLAHARGSGPVHDPAGLDFEPMPLNGADLLPPVTPSKIVCVGRNYREHAAELGNQVPAEPLLFFKPPSSLLKPGGVIVLPPASSRVDHEAEIALVIGKRCSKLASDVEVRDVVRGYTLANDVTARDLQKKDGQWTRAKGFDTFCPVGPWVSDEVNPAAGITIEARVNGALRQQGSTTDFIFSIAELLVYITAAITLEPGDLVLTGTPSGVGPLAADDVVTVSAPGLGTLSNSVAIQPS